MLGVYVNPHLLRPLLGEKAAGMLIEPGLATHFHTSGDHDLSWDANTRVHAAPVFNNTNYRASDG